MAEICVICQDDLPEVVAELPCEHLLCVPCVATLLDMGRSRSNGARCPVCRAGIAEAALTVHCDYKQPTTPPPTTPPPTTPPPTTPLPTADSAIPSPNAPTSSGPTTARDTANNGAPDPTTAVGRETAPAASSTANTVAEPGPELEDGITAQVPAGPSNATQLAIEKKRRFNKKRNDLRRLNKGLGRRRM